jgi:short-subunit dehydrogenase
MNVTSKTTALITGASSGIGKEMALELAKRGSKTILVARRKDRLEALAEKISSTYHTEAIILPCDLLEKGAASHIYEQLSLKSIEVDILVNNAGFGYKGAFLANTLESYRDMTMLNMTVLTELTWLFSKGMKERRFGGILNVASMAGFGPIPLFAVYAATKSYVISFSEALWHEMKEFNIHVSALCPGPVETEFFEVAQMDPTKMSLRTIQKADEVAKLAIDSLLSNKRVIPTSPTLKIMRRIGNFVPTRLSMSAAAAMMGKEI